MSRFFYLFGQSETKHFVRSATEKMKILLKTIHESKLYIDNNTN